MLRHGWEPQLVHEVADALVTAAGSDLGDFRTRWPSSAEDLVEIALTLHRLPETRSSGIDLFERLMILNVYRLNVRLALLDRRPFQ